MPANPPPTPEAPGERLTEERVAWWAHPDQVTGIISSEVNALAREVQRLREMERQVRALRRHQSSIFYMNGGGDDSYSEMTWVVKVSDLDAALGDAK
jgi:hypothetical protein